jgi:hypothetical protein
MPELLFFNHQYLENLQLLEENKLLFFLGID